MKIKIGLSVVATGFGLLLAVAPALPHHSFTAEYDGNKPVTLKGTVTKVEWINPHSWLHIDVKKPDGTVEQWMIEGGPPAALLRRGFKKDALRPGTEIVVDGYQTLSGSPKANGVNITFSDGRKLFAGSSGTGAPYEKAGEKR